MKEGLTRDPRATGPSSPPGARDDRNPTWLLLVVGWMFADTTLHTASRAPLPAPATPDAIDLDNATARDLRRLPGIGPSRAAAIVELRWERGGQPFELREVPGIGPRTEAKALAGLGRD